MSILNEPAPVTAEDAFLHFVLAQNLHSSSTVAGPSRLTADNPPGSAAADPGLESTGSTGRHDQAGVLAHAAILLDLAQSGAEIAESARSSVEPADEEPPLLPADRAALERARAGLYDNLPGLRKNAVSSFIAFIKHLALINRDRAGLQEPISITAFGPEGTWPLQDQEKFISALIAEDPKKQHWRTDLGAVFQIHFERSPGILNLRHSDNYEAVRFARHKLRVGTPGLTKNKVTHFIAFVKYLDAKYRGETALGKQISIECFGPNGTLPIQEQESFINDAMAEADYSGRGNWRAVIGKILGIKYETDLGIIDLKKEVNHEAIRSARAKKEAGVTGVNADTVKNFNAFIRRIDQDDISIESFGMEGDWSIQEQEAYINEVIAEDPAARGSWRSAVSKILGIRYEHDPGIVDLDEPANHAAVRLARDKVEAKSKDKAQWPGLLPRHVSEFIWFVKYLDYANSHREESEPPFSIESFGTEEGAWPIQDQELFFEKLSAKDKALTSGWQAAVSAVLEIKYEADPSITALHSQNYVAVRDARAMLKEGKYKLSPRDVSDFVAFVRHIEMKYKHHPRLDPQTGRVEPRITMQAFGPEGSLPLQEQELLINEAMSESTYSSTSNWRSVIGKVLEIRYESRSDVIELKNANYMAIRAAREKLESGAYGLKKNDVTRFVAFVMLVDRKNRARDASEPPISIEAFGPEGTWSTKKQEAFFNEVIEAQELEASARSAVGSVLGIRYEHDPVILGLDDDNYQAVRDARAKLAANATGVKPASVSYFIAFVKHLDHLNRVRDPATPPFSIGDFGPDGTWPIGEQEDFLKGLIAEDPNRKNWRPAINVILEIQLGA